MGARRPGWAVAPEGPVVAWLRGGELWGLRGRVQEAAEQLQGAGHRLKGVRVSY